MGQTENNGRINYAEIMVLLKYLINCWRALEMPLINCENKLILNWSAISVKVCTNFANQGATFEMKQSFMLQ